MSGSARRLPMFPLNSVLFPHALLPLRIFELRYLQMIRESVESDGEFGVVLIERGFEVGGGDQRFTVGTAARIVEVAELPAGEMAVLAVGLHRLRVEEWLAEDPYPLGMVTTPDDPALGAEAPRLVREAERALQRVLALASELGTDVGSLRVALSDDPRVASFQAATLAPVGPLDAQRLLELDATEDRLRLLVELLGEQAEVLEARLRGL